MKIIKLKIKNCMKGYTIIETMIAVSLFLVIIMAGMGALLNANLLHNKSQNMRSIMDNLSFIMEDMSRNLRTGYNYRCYSGGAIRSDISVPNNCDSGWGIFFEQQDGDLYNSPNNPGSGYYYGDQWAYYIGNDAKIYKSSDYAGGFIPLTPDEVKIDPYPTSYFIVSGTDPFSAGNTEQPFVTIKLSGTITFKNIVTPFSLQTSVSQRQLDNI
ncbi:hypothetical protein A2643_01825 [Candidatus Nomurabacteria bacterium RIFCSPHIGHO2_01_FULL_39_220]|uniref:Type II secretion system protein n=1 Tax=Candidatus Nomurabacteria bacterium RIFCSPLOWO2_02_FULL_40_67 TaxID=1801787 RepID=A0A1F6Y7G6_9BACT|nr:MAG: hypothetical protein UU66_C0026G0004 [Parcubacteria group bacterium GW2011_GWB1_41_5]OGI62145.1 MAG: hypothetical protein A2W12_00895 [Candidatus Nomurabacteria bacterium RBG_16_40_11]OGI70565.1 MAG: hypothetical protein A2643_01825 [Candidatus Nomurabacteria bacterium RIFCSPHIGHO2_01_FULL_39_220]OGI72011.1 MAG: hypothetical protein A2W56_03215 [Candidatus Nomurabacteria bacterium RIFCSPHIGHO2_02_41_18]OGI79035.1 MAG: hypothetical protein A3C65_01375 [Candidatus Nomurabacteria bacterium